MIKELEREYKRLIMERKKLEKEIKRDGYTVKFINGYSYLYKAEWDKKRKKQVWKSLGNVVKLNKLMQKIDSKKEENLKKIEEIDRKIAYIEEKVQEILKIIKEGQEDVRV